MELSEAKIIAETVQSAVTTLGIIMGGAWALRKYAFRKEDFPRIDFSVDVNFVGRHQGEWVIEILGLLQNKGLVPHPIQSLRFNLRMLSYADQLTDGGDAIGGQLLFPRRIKEAPWTPAATDSAMVIHPGVSLRYNYIYHIPESTALVLVHGILDYGKDGLQHRADRLLKVPDSRSLESGS